MPYCKNCGNQLAETAKFCSKCGQQILIQEKKSKPKWSLEKFLIDNPPNDKGVIKCPRCLGKGHVEKKDISRLGMDGLLLGDCQYCDGIGLVNIKKIDTTSIYLNEESTITNDQFDNHQIQVEKEDALTTIENNNIDILDDNKYKKYVESGRLNPFPFIICVSISTLAAIILAYYGEYFFNLIIQIDFFGSATRVPKIYALIVELLWILPYIIISIGLALSFFAIRTIGKVRNTKVCVLVFLLISIICWISSHEFSLISSDWFSFGGILKLVLFLVVALFSGLFDYIFCERCNIEFKDETFYTLIDISIDDYINKLSVDHFENIVRLTHKDAILNSDDKTIIKNELHKCSNCGDLILTIKCCEIVKDDKGRLSLKDNKTVLEKCYI